MATNDFSVQYVRRHRTLTIIKGNASFINKIIGNIESHDHNIYCVMSEYDSLNITDEELYDIVDESFNRLSDIRVLYTDNNIVINGISVRQYLPSITYDNQMMLNTPFIFVGKTPILLNEKLKRLFLWDYLSKIKKITPVGNIPSNIFTIKPVSNKEQEEDLKCLKQ